MSTDRSISKLDLLDGLVAWQVGDHADVRALLTDPSVSKDLRNGPPGLAGDEVHVGAVAATVDLAGL